jgi:hypothetical protein
MTTWARKNDNGDIVELTTEDPSGKFHESVVWEVVNDSTSLTEDNGITAENNQDLKDLLVQYDEYIASITNQEE